VVSIEEVKSEVRSPLLGSFVLLSLGALLYLVARLLLPYAEPILWATILAVVFDPAHRLVLGFMPRYPSLAAGLLTVLIFVAVVVPALLMTGLLARQAVDGYQRFAAYVASGSFHQLNDITTHWAVAPVWNWLRERLAEGEVTAAKAMLGVVRWASEFAATNAASVARNVFGFLVGLGIMLFSLFFALRDGREMVRTIETAVPLPAADRSRVLDRMRLTVVAVVQGLTITAAVQGLLLGIGIWLVGVPYAALLGTVGFALSFLPGGTTLIWLPTALTLLGAGSYVKAGLLAGWCILLVGSADNILRPLLIGPQLQLSTPLLLIGILGGLRLYGVIGLFLGPAILALFSVVLAIYRERVLATEHTAA